MSDAPQTHYIRNEEGAIHTVSHDHFVNRLHQKTAAGNSFLLPGYTEVKESEARKAHPQLFGAPDPQITLTDEELVRAAQRRKLMAELYPDTTAE